MVFSYLKEDNLGTKYRNAEDYTASLTKSNREFERIASNKPSEIRDDRYTDVTDGTTAGVVRKLGKRIVQQLPTGVVTTDAENDWLPIVADFVYRNKILPYAVLDYDLLQKCWQVLERGAITGSQAIYTPFVNHDGEFTSDMSLPYWGDIKIPKGSKSGSSHKYLFMRTIWLEDDFDEIIEQQKKLTEDAKKRAKEAAAKGEPVGEEYKPTWDIKALEKAKKKLTSKDQDTQNPIERDKGLDTDGVEVVVGMQIGVNAMFYTFVPDGDGDKNDVIVIRRKRNKDPRGKMPVDWYYNDTDGFNPLGRGLVELVGALQNLIDTDMQMYQWNRALMLNPPMMKKGNFSKRKIVWAPGAIIDVGTDREAEIKPLSVDTSAVANYPELYGLQKSQMLNLVSSPDQSISATVGNPGFSKTSAGVKDRAAVISVDDNHVRKNFEAMWESWSETAINVYFAERVGKQKLQLDKETASKLRKLADEGKFDPSLLNDNDEIIIDYDTATPALKFRVDASTSKLKEDAAQGDILKELLSVYDTSPTLQAIIPKEKVVAVWNRIVASSAVEDPEELSVDIAEFKKQLEIEAANAQRQIPAGMSQEPQIDPSSLSDEDRKVVGALKNMNVPDEYINQVLVMLANGYSADDVLAAIGGMLNARG